MPVPFHHRHHEVAVLTYRKGKADPVLDEAFEKVSAPCTDRKKSWELADGEVTVGRNKLKMRQIARRKPVVSPLVQDT